MVEKLLIVENNADYLKAAKEYFSSMPDVEVSFASNYQDAKALLPKYNKVLIDIFIPESKNEKLGKEGKDLLEKFEHSLKEKKANCLVDRIKQNKPLHQSLLKFAEYVLGIQSKEIDNNSLDAIVKKIDSTSSSLGSKSTWSNKDLLAYVTSYSPELEMYNTQLENLAWEKKQKHSPLGVNLAKEAEKLNISYAFVTDGHHHHHSPFGEAIRNVFFEDKGCTIIDTSFGSKACQDFWKRAYELVSDKDKIFS